MKSYFISIITWASPVFWAGGNSSNFVFRTSLLTLNLCAIPAAGLLVGGVL